MGNLKQMLFQQYASASREEAAREFQEKYEPKRGGRFHLGGITYEIGPVEVEGQALQFEISSKIPKEQLQDKMTREQYFEAVKKLAPVKGEHPVYLGMDDIVHKVGDREIKKRDYIRLKYRCAYGELYDEKAIVAEVQAIHDGKSDLRVPEIPGVQSLCGRLTLIRLKENMRCKIKKCMQGLIDANEKVRKQLK